MNPTLETKRESFRTKLDPDLLEQFAGKVMGDMGAAVSGANEATTTPSRTNEKTLIFMIGAPSGERSSRLKR